MSEENQLTSTVNGNDPKSLTKEEALQYCHDNANAYKAEMYSCNENGERQFDCLIGILEDGTIEPHEIVDYGMCDQDLELEK